ncbi:MULTISPECIES: FecCD family ABC transporter permease [unclassified Rathayibacter]|uniref:FecCD family ABC transporter permease n=1 Tax=unclassified Rathayibacter TaxID=2609250 RepID=UPI00188BCD16|nr:MULTISPECIES: iron ABC transporter permease [unclassified Rathayibacter]MBF4463088.1 iron ABC transporter permease [Rathayibacter sp. VKM Ac-2879]MBF4504675.1 iron ABC transporter permease [Rathayibacter sp. VKM Ac-2878]
MTAALSRRRPGRARGQGPSGRIGRRFLALAAVLAAIAVACVLSLVYGSREIPLDEIWPALTAPDTSSIVDAAVQGRVPRTVLALLVGAALALAGAVMQGLTRNPLADPGILGLNSGASLAVVLGISTVGATTLPQFIGLAFVGAAVAGVFVYGIAALGRGGATPLTLALAGAATAAVLVSLTSAVLLTQETTLNRFRFWQVGGVGGAEASSILQVLPVLVLGGALAVAGARGLDALALGDELATGLGRRVGRIRLVAGLAAVLLCGGATAIAGPIGFVGLVVPHLARRLTGPSHAWLLPSSALVGALLLVVADVVGRVVARPSDIEVGIVTALIGAPVLIAIVRRSKVRSL